MAQSAVPAYDQHYLSPLHPVNRPTNSRMSTRQVVSFPFFVPLSSLLLIVSSVAIVSVGASHLAEVISRDQRVSSHFHLNGLRRQQRRPPSHPILRWLQVVVASHIML